MTAMKISVDLSTSGIRKAQRQLRLYQKALLAKCEEFVLKLSAKGISAAKMNISDGYRRYVVFHTETNVIDYGATAIMLATQTGVITSEWRVKGGTKTADVSPLLMAEFGAGLRSNSRAEKYGMGTGTFPGQTHAEDPDGWWYMTLDGEWHHSYGITPTMPMYHAYLEMFDKIYETAREVFKT